MSESNSKGAYGFYRLFGRTKSLIQLQIEAFLDTCNNSNPPPTMKSWSVEFGEGELVGIRQMLEDLQVYLLDVHWVTSIHRPFSGQNITYFLPAQDALKFSNFLFHIL